MWAFFSPRRLILCNTPTQAGMWWYNWILVLKRLNAESQGDEETRSVMIVGCVGSTWKQLLGILEHIHVFAYFCKLREDRLSAFIFLGPCTLCTDPGGFSVAEKCKILNPFLNFKKMRRITKWQMHLQASHPVVYEHGTGKRWHGSDGFFWDGLTRLTWNTGSSLSWEDRASQQHNNFWHEPT